MNDSIALQYALYRGLQSCTLFNAVNVVLGREYIAKRVEQETAWLTPGPNGNCGIGIIVLTPQIYFPKPNGLQRERMLGVAIYENPNDNWQLGVGTMLGLDDWADTVVDFLWNWRLLRTSGLILQEHVTVEDNQFSKIGILGTIVMAQLRQERAQTARAATPQISATGQTVTLTVADGSAVYFTTDGQSAPSPKTDGTLPGEQAATLYTAPFNVAPNTTVMAAAFAAGLLPSQTAAQLIQ